MTLFSGNVSVNSGELTRYASRSGTVVSVDVRLVVPSAIEYFSGAGAEFLLVASEVGRWFDGRALGACRQHIQRGALGDHTRERRARRLDPRQEEDGPGLSPSAATTGVVGERVDVVGQAEVPLPEAGIPLAGGSPRPRARRAPGSPTRGLPSSRLAVSAATVDSGRPATVSTTAVESGGPVAPVPAAREADQ